MGQLVLVFIGLIVWGYGQRIENEHLTWAGIGCFAAATILRLFRKRE